MSRRPYELRQTRWCYRVSWQAHAGLFDAMLDDWRRTVLPRCRGAHWLPEEKCWHLPSVPAYKFRVVAFLERWYDDLIGVNCTPDPEHVAAYHSGDAADGHHETAGALAEAYAILHLRTTAPPELVESARRVLARTVHPDAGGDEEAMRAVNAAADTILTAARSGAGRPR